MAHALAVVFDSCNSGVTMARRPRPKQVVDTEWFHARVVERYGSLRKMAPHLHSRTGEPMTIWSLSTLLRGARPMHLHEAQQLATTLGLPLTTILLRVGVGPEELTCPRCGRAPAAPVAR